MNKVFIIFLLLWSSLNANNIDLPLRSELGKIGEYKFQTTKLPDRYSQIWLLSKFSSDILSNRTSTRMNHYQWIIYVPKKYNEKKESGLAIITTSFDFETFPENWKRLAENKNIILIAPVLNTYLINPLEMSYAAYELIQIRYKLKKDFITYVALSQKFNHHFYLHSSDILSGVIGINSSLKWEKKRLKLENINGAVKEGSSLIFSFYTCDKYGNTNNADNLASDLSFFEINDFKNIFSIKSDLKPYVDMSKIISRNSSLLKINYAAAEQEFIFKYIKLAHLEDLFRYKEKQFKIDKVALFKKAEELEADQKLGEAITIYKYMSDNFSETKAFENFKRLAHQLNQLTAKAKKLFEGKDYFQSVNLCKSIVKSFGKDIGSEAQKIIITCSNNMDIFNELKAAAFLAKAEAALKLSPPPTDKIKAACEKVIKTVPRTKTAEKAKKILKGLN